MVLLLEIPLWKKIDYYPILYYLYLIFLETNFYKYGSSQA
jgi:hypothetical protein